MSFTAILAMISYESLSMGGAIVRPLRLNPSRQKEDKKTSILIQTLSRGKDTFNRFKSRLGSFSGMFD